MTNEEYALAQRHLMLTADILSQHDWGAMQARINHTESTAFLFATPADYQTGTPRLAHIKQMAESAAALVAAHGKLKALVAEQEIKV